MKSLRNRAATESFAGVGAVRAGKTRGYTCADRSSVPCKQVW